MSIEIAVVAARERRQVIAELLEEEGRVSVAELAERFGVTDVSIRRDLVILEDAGQLRRVHGGAVSPARGRRNAVFAAKARDSRDAKVRIGRVAAAMIAPGQAVIFDSGTTVSQVAVHVPAPLRRGTTLTVVTNSLPVIDEVAAWDGPALMVLGGLYLPDHQALVGPQTVADLRAISADLLFVGCDGLTLETGLTTPNVLVAEVAATMVARAERVVVVADGSKLGRRGFRPFAALSAVDVLVTNAEADPAQVQVARDAGIEVVLV